MIAPTLTSAIIQYQALGLRSRYFAIVKTLTDTGITTSSGAAVRFVSSIVGPKPKTFTDAPRLR